MDAQQKKSVPVIGIGSSAGGLEAVSKLLSYLDPGLKHALVILQHLSPNYKSMMAELLTRETRLEVRELSDNTIPCSGVVYVVPANKNAVYRKGKIVLTETSPEISPKPSVNEFFISLASELGENAIGVILSGTGSDGTAGLRAIQAAGGISITQDPNSAKYSGMPCSAIEEEVVDFVLKPEDIARKLLELPLPENLQSTPVTQSVLERLLKLLKHDCNIDFSGYKAGTLSRRIRRRMVATGFQVMEDYLAFVEENTSELELLSKDILISVTSFFRDKEAFSALNKQIADHFEQISDEEEIRVWVAGCATGEEAYSLAILILEQLESRKQHNPIQIFATDIDEEALNFARLGIYNAASLANIPEELRHKYFSVDKDNAFEVKKSLRDLIVFARHNLIDDPPFLRLDLVSCRNVLIYFDNALQAKVLQRFHFALKSQGNMFLGRSESVAQAEQLFSPVNRRERIFQKLGDSKHITNSPAINKLAPLPKLRSETPQLLLNAITEQMRATAALCTSEGEVIQSSGDVNRFFRFPSGSPVINIADIILPELQSDLLPMLHKLRKTHEDQRSLAKEIDSEFWSIQTSLIRGKTDNRILVLILPTQEPTSSAQLPDPEGAFSDELQVTKEQLQSVIEELATANEEMQSLNEEAQASNEELQATNEEMEAANEELQATNEELVSLNEELSVKTSELSLLNNEYAHLYDSFDFPVLVFDNQLTLMRFNAPATVSFNLKVHATGMHVSRLRFPAHLDQLEEKLQQVISHGDKQETLIQHLGNVYQLIISPGLNDSGEVQFLVVNLVDITDIQDTRQRLSESENRLSTIMENTTILISMKDLSGNYIYANDAFLKAFSLDSGNYEGKSDYDLFPEGYASQIWTADLEAIRSLVSVESEAQMVVDDQVRIYQTLHQVLRDVNGKPNLLITETEDITSRRQAEDKLRIAARVFQQAGEAIVVTDKNSNILSVNEAFTDITGYYDNEAIGKDIGALLNSGRHSSDFFEELWNSLQNRGHWQGEIWNKRKNGDIYPEWLTINRVDNGANETEYFIAVFSDITNLKESQRKVEFLATHDALTGLPNRNLFQDRLDNAIARCRRNDSNLAVIFIDLDDFKSINDTLGHDIGDQLLIKVAKKLQVLVRDVDTVSRLGGDEFTIVLSECDPQEVQFIANRILDEFSESIDIDNHKIFASASIGISMFPEDGTDTGGLLKSSDTAMYRAKELGRNQYQFFHAEMRDKLLKQSAMESSIKNAIRLKQFRLVFQPKYSLEDDSRIVGAETLLRWYAPNIGEISPAEFIPVAEQNGSIIELSNLVMRMLVEQVARWLNQGLQVPEIAFNVSAKSFQQERFVTQLSELLEEYLVSPHYFKVEITEGSVMGKSSNEMDNLAKLKDAGIAISIDDFGTGYSSLNYLKQLPISELKIDKSFVDGLGSDENDEAISQAILSMSKALGLDVVAEGVENEQQLEWLKTHHCDYMQGFLRARPLEIQDFEKLMFLKDKG